MNPASTGWRALASASRPHPPQAHPNSMCPLNATVHSPTSKLPSARRRRKSVERMRVTRAKRSKENRALTVLPRYDSTASASAGWRGGKRAGGNGAACVRERAAGSGGDRRLRQARQRGRQEPRRPGPAMEPARLPVRPLTSLLPIDCLPPQEGAGLQGLREANRLCRAAKRVGEKGSAKRAGAGAAGRAVPKRVAPRFQPAQGATAPTLQTPQPPAPASQRTSSDCSTSGPPPEAAGTVPHMLQLQ